MYYRILNAPPGYPIDQNYVLAADGNLSYDSYKYQVLNTNGNRLFPTIEEARRMLPEGVIQLPFEKHHQFLELWSDENEEF